MFYPCKRNVTMGTVSGSSFHEGSNVLTSVIEYSFDKLQNAGWSALPRWPDTPEEETLPKHNVRIPLWLKAVTRGEVCRQANFFLTVSLAIKITQIL
jgi:hypothetical protein